MNVKFNMRGGTVDSTLTYRGNWVQFLLEDQILYFKIIVKSL